MKRWRAHPLRSTPWLTHFLRLSLGVLLALAPRAASAEEPLLLVEPAPDTAAPRDPALRALATEACPAPAVLYLNFDGGPIQGRGEGCDDPRLDCSVLVSRRLGRVTIDYPAFTGDATRRAAIVELVRTWYSPFNIQIVTERPKMGPYSMVLVGGTPTLIGQPLRALGVAILECRGDPVTTTHVGFVFSASVSSTSVRTIAAAIAQESAHAYGLAHVVDPTDVMYPAANGQTRGFNDTRSRVPDLQCPGGNGTQNSAQLLGALLGPACAAAPPPPPPPVDAGAAPEDTPAMTPGLVLLPPAPATPARPLGSACRAGSECDSGSCADDTATGERLCTQTCSTTDCPGDFQCRDGYCMPAGAAGAQSENHSIYAGCATVTGPSAMPLGLLLLLLAFLRIRPK